MTKSFEILSNSPKTNSFQFWWTQPTVQGSWQEVKVFRCWGQPQWQMLVFLWVWTRPQTSAPCRSDSRAWSWCVQSLSHCWSWRNAAPFGKVRASRCTRRHESLHSEKIENKDNSITDGCVLWVCFENNSFVQNILVGETYCLKA